MNHKIKKIISAEELDCLLPISEECKHNICNHRQEIKNILSGKDKRLILIIGPCSAWPNVAVLEYANRLKVLSNKVADKLKIIIRVYTHKPRTTIGWQGSVMQPDPLKNIDINLGLKYSREMMLDVVKLNIPIASEILNISLHNYFIELLSWVAIGARSSENQEHRLFSSYLDLPTGLKNPTHGSLEVAVNSILTAQHKHSILLNNHLINTNGNEFAHLVLRGGNKKPNFSNANLEFVNQLFIKNEVQNPSVIIDVSHDNSIKNNKYDYNLQSINIFKIIKNIKKNPNLTKIVKGFMVESFLEDGNQKIDIEKEVNLGGLSITDPCIGWEQTEKLIINLAKEL
jgi:3-deoxy-7-phosphoheptulonate synthase